MPDGDRWQPPRVGAAEAALVSRLVRRRVPARGGRWAVRVVAAPVLEDAESFAITLSGAPARIDVPRAVAANILSALDPAAAAAEGAPRRLLMELALDDVADALEGVLPIGPAESAETTLSVGLDLGDWAAVLHVSEDAAWRLCTALELLAPDPVVVPAPVPLGLRLGACDLPIAELRATAPGDVLLPSAGLSDPGFVLVVAEERWVWQGRRAPAAAGEATIGVELVSPRSRAGELGVEGWMMDDETPAMLADASLDELPVRVVFEAGRIEVAMGELALIGPGHVFTLPGGVGLVDILANGRRIGQGELVQIGESAGVRLLRLTA